MLALAMAEGDAFDFYPCLVDDAPASIYVNLRFEHERPIGADTRYTIIIRMRDAGPHGAGTEAEAEVINAYEESAIEALAAHQLVYVGRLRTQGSWDITFYGPPGRDDDVRATTKRLERTAIIDVQPDEGWRFYLELLFPDAERLQWMDDRRLVQVLGEQGDNHATPRRVDHWAYFATAEARDAFVAAAQREGFELEEASVEELDNNPFGAWVYRTDPIDLDHIHAVVMKLVDAAVANGGGYDGWETSIER